jgi:hypothetical protein
VTCYAAGAAVAVFAVAAGMGADLDPVAFVVVESAAVAITIRALMRRYRRDEHRF